MAKTAFARILEPDENVVHIDAPPGLDQVTLCGITDWLGGARGQKTTKPLTCWHCRSIAEFCQSHRKLALSSHQDK